MRQYQIISLSITLLLLIAASACGSTAPATSQAPEPTVPAPTATEAPEVETEPTQEVTIDPATVAEFWDLDPANFSNSTVIDNVWMPMKPGTRWVHEGTALDDGNSFTRRIEFTVTDLTKEIAGVQTVVAWIVDYNDGEVVEKEMAFYAQDKEGNVWYLGEYPQEYENGEFVKASPWIHGVEDARAGIKMVAQPELGGPSYYQGWGPAVEWSDYGQVDQMAQETCVPVDCYTDVLVIAESSLGEVDAFQLKFYARGVGEVRVGWKGEDESQEELELIDAVQLGPEEMAEVRAEALELEKSAYEHSKAVYGQTPPAEIFVIEEIPLTGPSLLTGEVTMCDTGVNLISFRLAESPPDLTGKTLTAQIAEQESTCYINPTNPSLMTCTLPPGVTFPAQVVVSVDGAVVNDFVYDGLGCAQITTPMPTTTP